jgi:asparagine synthase (glutamine-hydrolysing)
MCGIAGLVSGTTTQATETHEVFLRRMCELQEHRGPDDRGTKVLGNVGLGSVRLSILDLSEAGHMPMADASERYWIAYNGEVYNFEELRTELEAKGHAFRSKTDTEVVLHAFIEWGAACVEHLVGMFAFAVYDRETDTLALIRDRYGIKPLYYMRREGDLYFASEIKALMRIVEPLQVDRQSLVEWTLYQNVDVLSPETLIEGIKNVLPGQCVTVRTPSATGTDAPNPDSSDDLGELTTETTSWYAPPARVDEAEFRRFARMDTKDIVDELDTTLTTAIVDRLVSDVPVGTLLSGGLDSSLVTAIAAQHKDGLKAFHVSIAGVREMDERPHAEACAKNLGIELICDELDGKTFRRELPRTIYQSDVPLTHANSVAYARICRKAREHGVIVLLSGEGADELFGGYKWRYRRHRNALRARKLLHMLPRKIWKGIELAGYTSAGMPVNSHRFDELLPQTVSMIDRYARRAWLLRCEEAYAFVEDPLDRALLGAMLGDLDDFLTPLLRRLDRMSMSASVETRVPFLDHRLVEKAMHLPLDTKIGRRADKWILRRIADRHLPPNLVERPKLGFPLPLREWVAPLAKPEMVRGGFCEEVLQLHPRGIVEFLETWARNPTAFLGLLSLELWGRMYLLNETVEELDERIASLEHASS